MESGQADTGPGTIDDLASFLADTPEADSGPEIEDEGQPSDEPADADNSDEPTEDAPADEDEESSEDDAEKPPSDLKFKVPVKGEDGQETTVEVDQKELIAGYQRHADYTRKTMELADKEREVTQAVVQKLDEGRNYYLQQAQMAHAAVRQLAGLRTPEEMSALAATDPAAWVAEQQRQQAVQGILSQIEQGTQRERAELDRRDKELKAQAYEKTWETLSKDGIDKPKLKAIFDVMKSKYQVPDERLANVYDPVLVRIMRDAAAYQELKDKKATVVKKVAEAPKMPAARQSVPKNEQLNRQLNAKFSSGKAKLKDLAAFIANN
jgi:hypothetical protein